ncbi:MAG TPA: DNA repair protein RadA [Actinomycetota bacterium]|nr:DNA repair protein RadA [Actinomycetota bacterium]
MSQTFACAECGFSASKWFGRCPDCGAWSSALTPSGPDSLQIVTLDGNAESPARRTTGSAEVDRVLGGGLVTGSVILLAGEPGIGKSTLVLQLLDSLECSSLLVTGEESVQQVGMRATRLGLDRARLHVAPSTSISAVVTAAASFPADVLVIDSIQTLQDDTLEGSPGSPAQVRGCATRLVELAKATGLTVLLVGHVTKEGAVAGPKALEHVVDTVVTLDGERTGRLRLLRVTKNRFGPCDETGVFVMSDRGLAPVPDPSALFLEDRHTGVPGSVVLPTIDGTRPLLVEVQAMVTGSDQDARRSAIGLDARRLSMLVGVLATRAEVAMGRRDVFVAVAGGLNVKEPAADLAMCLALHTARESVTIDPTIVAFGEVGLAGEVRRVHSIERRLAEAARMGFARAIVPRKGASEARGIEVIPVADLREAFTAAVTARSGALVAPIARA